MGLITGILDCLEDSLFPGNPRFSLPRDPHPKRVFEYKIEKHPRKLATMCYECDGTGDDKNDYNPAMGEYYPCKVCHGSGEIPVEDKN
jgi:hypothetical protein